MSILRPPPENTHHRYHWIETNFGLAVAEWDDEGGAWLHMDHGKVTPEDADECGWKYLRPCDPAAIVVDPENKNQIAAVVGQIEIVCSDGNSDACRVAKYILTALKRLDEDRRKGELE